MRQFILLFALFLCCDIAVYAASTVECHCFQDRQYNPQNSRGADPYFLATTQNSLMAALFGVEKKSLVRAKMSGSDGEGLWIAHYLTEKGGQPLAAINRVRSVGESWGGVVAQLKIGADQLDSQFVARLDKPDELASFVVDDSLVEKLQVQKSTLAKLRSQGAANKELVLSVFIAQIGGIDPLGVYSRFMNGESWGKLLHDQGLFDGAGIEQKWKLLLKR